MLNKLPIGEGCVVRHPNYNTEMNCLNTYFAKILNIFLKHKSAGRCFQHSEETWWLEYCVFISVRMSKLRNPSIRCIHSISIVVQLVLLLVMLLPRPASLHWPRPQQSLAGAGRQGTVQHSTAQYSTVQLYSAGGGRRGRVSPLTIRQDINYSECSPARNVDISCSL